MSIALLCRTELKKIMQGNIHSTSRAVLITGASRGIGLELAKLFARDGFDLVLVARNESDLANVADELRRNDGVSVTVIPKDLSLPTAAEELYQELQREDIEVDILVNNAGFGLYGPFSSTDLRKELQMMQLNMVTLTQLVKRFLPEMLGRRSGKILNVSSTAAFTPGPNVAVYFASKAYVQSFTEALAEELKGTGVSATALCPGPTSTDFAERAGMAETRLFGGRLATAKEVCESY